MLFRSQGRWKKAKEQAGEMRKSMFGEKHPDTLASMANLASTCRNQGRWKEAEELEVQVVEIRKSMLPRWLTWPTWRRTYKN